MLTFPIEGNIWGEGGNIYLFTSNQNVSHDKAALDLWGAKGSPMVCIMEIPRSCGTCKLWDCYPLDGAVSGPGELWSLGRPHDREAAEMQTLEIHIIQ